MENKRQEGQNVFIDFYLGKCPNSNGVMVETIWNYSHEELETHHDFIQWIFISTKPSRVLPDAPLITPEIQEAFQTNLELSKRLVRSLELLLDHYGLKLEEGVVKKGKHFEERKEQMLGHNLLRIDRILTSLIHLGQQKLAQSFFNLLTTLYQSGEMGESFKDSYENHWKQTIASHEF